MHSNFIVYPIHHPLHQMGSKSICFLLILCNYTFWNTQLVMNYSISTFSSEYSNIRSLVPFWIKFKHSRSRKLKLISVVKPTSSSPPFNYLAVHALDSFPKLILLPRPPNSINHFAWKECLDPNHVQGSSCEFRGVDACKYLWLRNHCFLLLYSSPYLKEKHPLLCFFFFIEWIPYTFQSRFDVSFFPSSGPTFDANLRQENKRLLMS